MRCSGECLRFKIKVLGDRNYLCVDNFGPFRGVLIRNCSLRSNWVWCKKGPDESLSPCDTCKT